MRKRFAWIVFVFTMLLIAITAVSQFKSAKADGRNLSQILQTLRGNQADVTVEAVYGTDMANIYFGNITDVGDDYLCITGPNLEYRGKYTVVCLRLSEVAEVKAINQTALTPRQ